MINAIYVEDLLICDAERKEINNFKEVHKAIFQISDLRLVSFYLSTAVT